jgi:hypothetical protein
MGIRCEFELVCRIVLQQHYDRYHQDSRGGNSLRRPSDQLFLEARTAELRLGARHMLPAARIIHRHS